MSSPPNEPPDDTTNTIIQTAQIIVALFPFLLVIFWFVFDPPGSDVSANIEFWICVPLALLFGTYLMYKSSIPESREAEANT